MPLRPSHSLSPVCRALLAAGIVFAAGPAFAQAPPQATGTYKNVQILKELSPAQLHDTMVFFEAVVGGNCQACHVRGADGTMAFEKDDNDHKVTTRKMIEMVRAINAQHFKGEEVVTCATCHQARREPNPLPPLAQPFTLDQLAAMPRPPATGGAPGSGGPGGPAPGAPGGPGGGPQRPTETVDQVLDKYVQALGSREALERVTTRTRRGTQTNRAGQAMPVVIEDTASGQYRVTTGTEPSVQTRAWDGTAAWGLAGPRVRDFEGVEAANIGLPADLGLPLTFKTRYQALAVQAYRRIAGHEVIVVQGRRAGGVSETFMFDRTTGLLARRIIQLKTPLGSLPVQIDYNDYRPVDGVQMAFDVRVTDWESVSAMTFTEVRLNQPIDSARFAKPASQPGR